MSSGRIRHALGKQRRIGGDEPAFDDLPLPADTANLRLGANLNDALLALLPLVGVWRGEGEGRGPDGDQTIRARNDGRDERNP